MCNLTAADVPFWGIPTSSVDWCEKNYQVCHFIAEFWNTVTSSFIAIVGIVGLYLTIREKLERRFSFLYVLIILVGLGSVAFHGTLQLEHQLLDEVPMLWAMMGWVYIIYTMKSPSKGTGRETKLAVALASSITLWSLGAPWIHYYYPKIFQSFFVLLIAFCAYNLHQFYHICKNPTARKLYVFYNASIILGACIWLVDKEACNVLHELLGNFWWHKYVGSFHGYWHALMTMNVYVGPVFAATVRAQMLGTSAAVCWWGGLFPYLKVNHKRPRLMSGDKIE